MYKYGISIESQRIQVIIWKSCFYIHTFNYRIIKFIYGRTVFFNNFFICHTLFPQSVKIVLGVNPIISASVFLNIRHPIFCFGATST